MFDLSGKTAVVTGGGQFVGEAISHALAGQGAKVFVNDIVAERAEAVAAAIVEAGGAAVAKPFDVTDLEQVKAAFAEIDVLDIVVNNAGNGGATRMVTVQFKDMTPDQWEGPIQVNLYGVLNTTHAALSGMVERGHGRIITISSGAGNTGVPIGVSTYGAAKAGGQSFMRMIASENSASGVTANSIAVGLIPANADSEITAKLARNIPAGRVGTPADIAPMVVYLASNEAEWVTGQTVHVNGGNLMT